MQKCRKAGRKTYRAGIFKQSKGARNQVGIGLLYRPARLHMLAEFIPWNPFLGSINHKRLKIQAQMYRKTIAYLKTDRHTDRQTDRQTEQTSTEWDV